MKTRWMVPLCAALAWGAPELAHACGCFALPSPDVPIVQAGERILFAKDGSDVVAYIQIQYQGQADDFAWLVPLPAVPRLDVGTDELFVRLQESTQPRFELTTNRMFCNGSTSTTRSTSGFGCGANFSEASPGDRNGFSDRGSASDMGSNALVEQSSIGPYEYAVLKADDQLEMLDWLKNNRFFVPAGTDEAVKPYVRPGAYFLALKLRAGQSAGDIAPVILRYQSDLPMIPIILTQVGAVPDMGILVWVLGSGRAIPRNYHHTVLDEMGVWLNAESYNRLLVRAVKEAPKKHSFNTDYAGSSSVMDRKLVYSGRFGNLDTLRKLANPSSFLAYLRTNGYRFDSTLLAILSRYLPMPDWLRAQGVTPLQYYNNYDNYSKQMPPGPLDMSQPPPPPPFDADACGAEIDMRIVQPTLRAQALFDQFPYLTRLYTALSPEDMTADPVFSENQELPEVPLVRTATVTIPCKGQSWIRTDQGFEATFFGGTSTIKLPGSLRIEVLRDSGEPEVLTDNSAEIRSALGVVDHGDGTTGNTTPTPQPAPSSGGCSMDGGRDLTMMFLLLAALGPAIRRVARRRASH